MYAVFTLILTMAVSTAPAPEKQLPADLDYTVLRRIPVQHDGRWPPLDTVARDVVESVTGTPYYQGRDPMTWLLAWTFNPQKWMNQPLIEIADQELRAELKLPGDQQKFSYNELMQHRPLMTMINELSRKQQGEGLDPLESKVSEINSTLQLLRSVFHNQVIKPIPDPNDPVGAWRPIHPPVQGHRPQHPAVVKAWSNLEQAFVNNNEEAFSTASRNLAQALEELPAAHRPSEALLKTELHFHQLNPFRLAWIIMLGGAVLAALALPFSSRWLEAAAIVVLIVGFGMLSYGLWLRWQIAGRIPAANMYESLLFLSWGAGAFAIISLILMKDRFVPLTASAFGAIALLLSDVLPLDHYVNPIAPVLQDTIWMSIHVPVIMVSYSVLALAMLIAHGQLVIMAIAPRRKDLVDTVDSLHYWYIHIGSILLGVGILTGSLWAAFSWGRYWGWDPKEVWSLIAFLAYLTIIHVRVDREQTPVWVYPLGAILAIGMFVMVIPLLEPLTSWKIIGLLAAVAVMLLFVLARGQLAMAVKSVAAFWLLVMTYLGVNYILGIGLHSYGFGTGSVASYMIQAGVIDLSIVAICCLVYLIRRSANDQPSAQVQPAE